MSESNGVSGLWLVSLLIVICVAYLNFGATGAAAYALFFAIAGLIGLVGLIPIAGVIIYWYVAKFVGMAILTSAGVPMGATLFTAIMIYNGLFALLLSFIVTIAIIAKIIEAS